MKILVIQAAKLGDMVCSTPVFRAIKSSYPDASLVVCGDAINREILRGNPHIDGYILRTELLNSDLRNFDVAIMLTPSPEFLWKLIRSRIKKIIVPKVVGGFSPYATKKYRLLSLLVTTVPHRFGHYAPQEYLNMLRPLGIESTDTRKELYVEPGVKEKIKILLEKYFDKKLIGISPSAGNKIKEWPTEGFIEVGNHILGRTDAMIVLIGSANDIPLANEIAESLPLERVLNTAGKLSLEELKALISCLDMFIAVDTGPVYIAEAFSVPTIDIVGPMDEREQPPIGETHLVVIPERVHAELHIMNARMYNVKEAERQVKSITAEEVMAAYNKLIERI